MALESFLGRGDPNQPRTWAAQWWHRQSENKQAMVRNRDKKTVAFGKAHFFYQRSYQQPWGAAVLLQSGNYVRSVGCTVLGMIHIGKLHTSGLRPRGYSHLLLCISVSFACRGVTRLLRKGTQTSVVFPQDPPLVLPLGSQTFLFLLLLFFPPLPLLQILQYLLQQKM